MLLSRPPTADPDGASQRRRCLTCLCFAAGDHPQFGRAGPTYEGELLKKSDHVGEWRDRWFVLRERRLWYYETRADSKPMKGKPEGLPKGWFDTTAAKISAFEDPDEDAPDGLFYGFELEEEYGVWTGGMEAGGDKIRLCHSTIQARDEWLHFLKLAVRPAWVMDEGPGPSRFHRPGLSLDKDMETQEPFTFFNRKHHCRRCGGVFLGKNMVQVPVPELEYPEAVWVCNVCNSGKSGKLCSRWIIKVPKSQRGAEGKKKAVDEMADAAVETLSKTFSAAASFFGGGSDGS